MTIADLVAEARTVEWNFTDWCNASGYEANNPDTRQMFECLLALEVMLIRKSTTDSIR
jgi:hypothetical protein